MTSIHTNGIWYPGQQSSQLRRLSRELQMFFEHSEPMLTMFKRYKGDALRTVMNDKNYYPGHIWRNALDGLYERRLETMDDTHPPMLVDVLKYPREDERCQEGISILCEKIWQHKGDSLLWRFKNEKPFELEKEWSKVFQEMEKKTTMNQEDWKMCVAKFYLVVTCLHDKKKEPYVIKYRDDYEVLEQTYNATKQYWNHLEYDEDWRDVMITIDMDDMHAAPPPSTPQSTDNPFWVHL